MLKNTKTQIYNTREAQLYGKFLQWIASNPNIWNNLPEKIQKFIIPTSENIILNPRTSSSTAYKIINLLKQNLSPRAFRELLRRFKNEYNIIDKILTPSGGGKFILNSPKKILNLIATEFDEITKDLEMVKLSGNTRINGVTINNAKELLEAVCGMVTPTNPQNTKIKGQINDDDIKLLVGKLTENMENVVNKLNKKGFYLNFRKLWPYILYLLFPALFYLYTRLPVSDSNLLFKTQPWNMSVPQNINPYMGSPNMPPYPYIDPNAVPYIDPNAGPYASPNINPYVVPDNGSYPIPDIRTTPSPYKSFETTPNYTSPDYNPESLVRRKKTKRPTRYNQMLKDFYNNPSRMDSPIKRYNKTYKKIITAQNLNIPIIPNIYDFINGLEYNYNNLKKQYPNASGEEILNKLNFEYIEPIYKISKQIVNQFKKTMNLK